LSITGSATGRTGVSGRGSEGEGGVCVSGDAGVCDGRDVPGDSGGWLSVV
jgi:hypothetical protein